MRAKLKDRTRKLLKTAIEIQQLPALVPRQIACDFSLLHPRTFARAEERGELQAVKRNSRSVSYHKADLLAFLGITPSKKGKR